MSTEIFATFGPSCRDKDTLKRMVEAGLSGMRLNLSHTTLPRARDYIEAYCSVTKNPKIVIDMQGPELRIGRAELELKEGAELILGRGGIEAPNALIKAVRAGDELLLDDGKISAVAEKTGESIRARVTRGGYLSSRKSIKLKGADVEMPILTDHDLSNIRLAEQYSVTAVMQPFVRSGRDLRELRKILDQNGAARLKIYAKIENKKGVENIGDILPYADMIVIARGDLGNDMPLWELSAVQKKIEQACHRADKPYIVVTQLLASMEHNPIPTRAEVSDVFHAVYHGAAGVMITAESAIGKYPAEAVSYLSNIAKTVKENI